VRHGAVCAAAAPAERGQRAERGWRAGDARSPAGRQAVHIVSELRNFAFCAYATNWRNYIDVEMTTDGSLMPLQGGVEGTRRLGTVCVRPPQAQPQGPALNPVTAERCASRLPLFARAGSAGQGRAADIRRRPLDPPLRRSVTGRSERPRVCGECRACVLAGAGRMWGM